MKTVRFCLLGLLAGVVFVSLAMGQGTKVMLNEIYSRGVVGNLDWVEIYNPTSAPINISGYRIYDDGGFGGTKPKKPFPVGTIVPAKGFYVIITDTADFVGDNSKFGLSSTADKVWLEDTTTSTIIDSISFGAMTTTQTWGRGPDGGAWTLLNTITRGASNGAIMLNEIYSRGVAGNLDWVEVYNGVSASVNISGYRIYDDGGFGGTKPKKPFPVGTIIPAKGFYVIITDTADFVGDNSKFGLSSTADKVWLEDTTTATIIDSISFGAMSTTQTWGRSPDGGTWQLLNTITRGTTNGTGTGVAEENLIARQCVLHQNFPNPFNPSTAINFQLSAQSPVTLRVFDLIGREVALLVNGEMSSGVHTATWNAAQHPSGIYFCRLTVGTVVETRKMILAR